MRLTTHRHAVEPYRQIVLCGPVKRCGVATVPSTAKPLWGMGSASDTVAGCLSLSVAPCEKTQLISILIMLP